MVTDQGDALIAYAARLRTGGIVVSWASVLLSRRTEDQEGSSVRGVRTPSLLGDECRWQHCALDVSGCWVRASTPIAQVLMDGPTGRIVWSCHMPNAQAEVYYRGALVRGRGYVECLEMSAPAWTLPIQTLHWGRHLSNEHSLVWIAWDDDEAQQWYWLDGQRQPHARVIPTGIRDLSGERELRFGNSRDVRSRGVLSCLTATLPRLQAYLPGSLSTMHEHKQVSRSALWASGKPVDDGWALHEVVTW